MAYASQSGRARTSARNPEAHAICDRCGFRYNFNDLHFQYEWRGPTLQNIRILVCDRCLDVPQENVRTILIPPDPIPIINARPQDFVGAETDYRTTAGTTTDPVTGIPKPSTTLRVTQDCENRVTEQIGAPAGLEQNAVMPYNGGIQKAFGQPLPILSVSANGTATVTVTCSAVHNLVTNGQISVEGLANNAADGFYSVTVLTATAFTYQTYGNIAAGAILTPKTLILTTLVGLPYGTATIPQVGQ